MSSPFSILLKPNDGEGQHVRVGLIDRSGRYRVGASERPDIVHDDGFLGKFPPQQPSAADRAAFAKWLATLEGSEALCNAQTGRMLPPCSNEDLSDANAAYRHFLFGNGKDRFIDYERFISGDPVGARLITKLLSDFKQHVGIISKDRVSFSVVSEPYSIGAGGFVGYPETANWQKALGGHVVWVDANVSVIVNEKHQMEHRAAIMIHMEDRYNFNPGQHDVATGIPDSANGRFELTGLAKQYTNRGKIVRHIVWSEGAPGEGSASGDPEGRGRRPADNRRLRNRL